MTLEGPAVDEIRLPECLAELLSMFPMLDADFVEAPGLRFPIQVVPGQPVTVATSGSADGRRERAGTHRLRCVMSPLPEGRVQIVLDAPALSLDRVSALLLAGHLARRLAGPQAVAPPGDAVDFTQYTPWQVAIAAEDSELADEALAYWHARTRLLPENSPPSAACGPRHHFPVTLPDNLAVAVGDLARDRRLSVAAVLCAVWAHVLTVESGLDFGALGMSFDGRAPEELASTVGSLELTARVLPDLPASATLLAIAAGVEATCAEHAKWLHWAPAAGLPPLPAVVTVLPPAEMPAGWLVTDVSRRVGTAPLELTARLGPAGFDLWLDTDPAVADEIRASRLARAATHLLTKLIAHPDRARRDLDPYDAKLRGELIFVGPPEPRPAEFAPDIFWRRVAATPDEIALEAADGNHTFTRLAERVETLAAQLLPLGAGQERYIGVLLPRGTELVIAIQAIWRVRAVYVPLDVDDPPPRLAMIAGTMAFTAVVTDDAHAAALPAGMPVIVPAELSEPTTSPPVVPVHAESAAYVIFTSGTSGRPRGVAVSHGSLAAYLAWAADYALAGRTVPALTRPAFDASLKQLVAPWRNGGSVWLPAHDVAIYPDLLYEAVTERDGLAVNCVPSLWRVLLDLDEDPLSGGRLGASIARALIGGEPIDAKLLTRIRERMPATELVNLYGPTEATCNALAGVIEVLAGPAPLGLPLPGTSAYVLDDELRPVPPGRSGHLFIGGCGVARGYVGDPRQTAVAFLPDPFIARAGARMYDTGDIVEIRSDGSLIYLRRRDLQVKIRGHRVELEDVEQALRANDAVNEAVAVVRRVAGNEIVAFITHRPGGRLDRAEVLRELATRVPQYLIPSRLVVVDELPRTAGGKPDRSILRTRAETVPR